MPFKYANMQERILANTVQMPGPLDTHCWIWIGQIDKGGYGILNTRFKKGPRKGKVKRNKVHRLALVEFRGKRLNSKAPVMHKCDVRACCNPDHLKGNATYEQNNQDTVRKGRHRNQYSKRDM